MAILGLSSPWVIFYREIETFFRYDPDVHVVYSEEDRIVKLYVNDSSKADAIDQLLIREKTFGDTSVKTIVIPSNPHDKDGCFFGNIYDVAFCGNAAYSFTKVVRGVFPNDLVYVVFAHEVVQYFTDNIGDIYGQNSTLYQEIAKDIFVPADGVFYCTDAEGQELIANI